MNFLKIIFFALVFAPGLCFAKGVLFFGDSHVPGAFGTTLDQLLRTNTGLAVETYGVCGSVAKTFLSPTGATTCGFFYHDETHAAEAGLSAAAPHIQEVLDRMKPELTVVELGTNYAVGYEDAGISYDIAKMVKLIKDSGSRCVWVSMPDTRKFRALQPNLLALTQAALGQDCAFIDSTLLTHYPDVGGDGMHYSSPELKPIAVKWGESVNQLLIPFLPPVSQ
jgi:hypothetical protein